MTRSIAGSAQTVLGPIDPEQLGTTITHEHLLLDEAHIFAKRPPSDPDARRTFYSPLNMEALSRIYYAGHFNLDNFTMQDENLAIEEALHFKDHGGNTIIEVTPIGIKRDPEGLRRIAKATGLNIVMGSSYYVDPSLPPEVHDMSEDELAEGIIREFEEGAQGTDIKPGLIGEVGLSMPMTPTERRILKASARAQIATGAPLMVHPGRDPDEPLRIVRQLEEWGCDIERLIICHIDRTIFDFDRLAALAATGVVIEYDLFGHEHARYLYSDKVDQPNDADRLRYIRFLIDEGYGKQIVIAQDCDNKIYLRKYGGCGYAHILENVVPRALDRGFTQDELDQILIHTPRRLFTFAEPKA